MIRSLATLVLALWLSPAMSQQPAVWTMESLDRNVSALQHALRERMPLLTQDLPQMPIDNAAMTMRATGTLRANIDTLWHKGIAPQVFLTGPEAIEGAIATGATLQEAGIPVNIMTYLQPIDFWPHDETHWFPFENGSYPVYPLATATGAYERLLPLLKKLRAGDTAAGLPGVTAVAGLWMDYESQPQPWMGVSPAAQLKGAHADATSVASHYYSTSVPFPGHGQSVMQVYGTNMLNGWPVPLGFEQYAFDLRTWLLEQSARKALMEVYGPGRPWFGNFGEFFSSPSSPYFDDNGVAYPITRTPRAGTAAMPAVYANNRLLQRFGLGAPGRRPLNQTNADDVYWQSMLNTFSSSARNAGPSGKSVAWVSQYVRDETSGSYDYPMTVPLYEELLRHLWLRGCMRMSVFNPHDSNAVPGKWYMTADYSFRQLEYARAVMDEMLAFRSFLNDGKPMSFAVNPLFDHGPVWSGLALHGQAVVRAVSPNSKTTHVLDPIAVPGGATFANLLAPPDGATYLLGPGAERHRVDARPPLVYLQMTQDLADSSGNGHGGNVWRSSPSYIDPTFSADVPAAGILRGSYGPYANETNQYSVSLTRGANDSGNGVGIPNVNGIFNAPSFTLEAFIKVAAGTSQEGASVFTKGASAAPEDIDWAIRYRDLDGAGMIELTFGRDASTHAWIRTSGTPLTPGAWHHLAFTYEDAARQARLYVDGIVQRFGAHNGQISGSGVLAWDFTRHTGDQLVAGFFQSGITASLDEVRFTPEVLDPKQFLTAGRPQ